jgi:cytoskeletal protein RodZ
MRRIAGTLILATVILGAGGIASVSAATLEEIQAPPSLPSLETGPPSPKTSLPSVDVPLPSMDSSAPPLKTPVPSLDSGPPPVDTPLPPTKSAPGESTSPPDREVPPG